MIKDFLEPYFDESELKRLDEIVKKGKKLKASTSPDELDKVLFSLRYEILSLETKAFSRYTKQRDDADILKDCLEIIREVEPKDFSNIRFSGGQPSDIVKFSFCISNNTNISYIESYFSETKNKAAISKILFAIYDRTLEFYPDGFSEQDKKISFCIFNKAFFKALKIRETKEPEIDLTENQGKIKGFVRLKDSPTAQAIQDVINVSKRELENPNQISLFDLERQVDVWNESANQSPNARKITITKSSKNRTKFNLTFAVEDYKELLTGNATAQKLLLFLSEKWLAAQRGQSQNARIQISIHEFAERIGADDDRNARKALTNAAKLLKNLKFETKEGGYIYIFPSFFIGQNELPNGQKVGVRGHATIDVSSYIDLSEGGEFTKYMPLHTWQLNKNAWFLANYVYTILRNDAKNTAEHLSPDGNSYTKKISLLSVLPVLNLPHPSETDRIEQLILDPIRKAKEEINRLEEKNHGALRLKIKIDTQKAPVDRVTDGYLVITLKAGAYLDSLKETSQKRLEHKADAVKRKEETQKRIESAKGREFARLEKREKEKNGQN